ncbi:hypothetical protein [Celerinatantimonas sp. MCCC 1A17872]|uniref:hypothetical protein n=1 Tax=Celerinatantimonas sp. MCCC 1A17872 TaxID=3177514 RepID=UPI0038C5E0F7
MPTLANISVKQKLFIPAVLFIVLLVVVGVFFSRNQLLIKDIKKTASDNARLIEQVYKVSGQVQTFALEHQGFEQVDEGLQRLVTQIKDSTVDSKQQLIELLEKTDKNVQAMKNLYAANNELNAQMMSLTASSIKESDDYIMQLSGLLGDSATRDKVSTFEGKIIGAALVNTTNNYRLQVIFQRLESDPSAAKSLMDYLGNLQKASDDAMEQLKGTPLIEKAKKAREVNYQVKEISDKFINNLKRAPK